MEIAHRKVIIGACRVIVPCMHGIKLLWRVFPMAVLPEYGTPRGRKKLMVRRRNKIGNKGHRLARGVA